MADDTAGSTVADTSRSTPCDVFALACGLRNELAAIEERQEKAKDFAERLEHQRRELQGQLYALELAEDEEKTVTKTLKEELARAGTQMFGPSWTRNSESTADLESSAMLLRNRILDGELCVFFVRTLLLNSRQKTSLPSWRLGPKWRQRCAIFSKALRLHSPSSLMRPVLRVARNVRQSTRTRHLLARVTRLGKRRPGP